MGGGDLNLKKSWHPSTMRNMEKVWKAEQKHDQEQKRIAELQREIREEKAREVIQKYAQDSGVIEKKDDTKLDWMYKGPGGMVDREAYLLGRAIDKSFEQMQHAEKAFTSLSGGGGEQVDMARKLQEDPLYVMRKREIESRNQILKNPVKLKHLQELIREQKSKKMKKHKKYERRSEKKKNKCDSDSQQDAGEDLDALLAAKYMKLKEKLRKANIPKLRKDQSRSSDIDAGYRHKSDEKHEVSSSCRKRKRLSHSLDDRNDYLPVRTYGLQQKSGSRNRSYGKNHQPELETQHCQDELWSQPSLPKKRWVKPERKKLSEEELEQKRKEMTDNAKWREKEREKNIANLKAQNEEEKIRNREYNGDFFRKQLLCAASEGSVEGRIKANINNIQRSGREMNKNFARR